MIRTEKKKYLYKYAVEEHGESYEDAMEFASLWEGHLPQYVAEEMAEYEFHNRDGWEAEWPLTFRLWDADGEELGVFEIKLEEEPSFHATIIHL